jgi:hypothetical protein
VILGREGEAARSYLVVMNEEPYRLREIRGNRAERT